MIEVEKLVFPSGTATAKTIEAMFATSEDTISKAKVLTACGVFCGFWAIITYFIPYLEVCEDSIIVYVFYSNLRCQKFYLHGDGICILILY